MKNNCINYGNYGIEIKASGNKIFGLIVVNGELHVFCDDKNYKFDYDGTACDLANKYWKAIDNGTVTRVSYTNLEDAKKTVEITAGITMYEVLLPLEG